MAMEKWRFSRGLTPLRPVRELEEMRRRFEEDFARPFMHSIWERIPEEEKRWAPAVDVFEKGDSYVVKVQLPGMNEEDIDVSVAEDTLIVKGERKPETGVKDEDYHRNEIVYGGFYRSISLPSEFDTRAIEAVYEQGILRITLHRASGAKPKKVSIQVKKAAA